MDEIQTKEAFNLSKPDLFHEGLYKNIRGIYMKCLSIDFPKEIKDDDQFGVTLAFSNKTPFGYSIGFHEKQKFQAQLNAKTKDLYSDILHKPTFKYC